MEGRKGETKEQKIQEGVKSPGQGVQLVVHHPDERKIGVTW